MADIGKKQRIIVIRHTLRKLKDVELGGRPRIKKDHGYYLMDNHYHLIIEALDNLSKGMHSSMVFKLSRQVADMGIAVIFLCDADYKPAQDSASVGVFVQHVGKLILASYCLATRTRRLRNQLFQNA